MSCRSFWRTGFLIRAAPSDSGEYLSVNYESDGYFIERYVSSRTQTLTVTVDILPGDVNLDGKVDVTDATLIRCTPPS